MWSKDEQSIINVINLMRDYYNTREVDKILDLLSRDKNTISFGSAEDEVYIGYNGLKQALLRDFSEGASFGEIDVLNIQIRHSVAWVVATIKMKNLIEGTELVTNGRVSYVLELIDNSWIFQHAHYSFPHAGSEEGRSAPTIKGIEREIKKWIENFDVNVLVNEEHQNVKLKSYLIKALAAIDEQRSDDG
jgi:hypothetical protein